MSDTPLKYVEDIYRRRVLLAEKFPLTQTSLDDWATEALGRSIAAIRAVLDHKSVGVGVHSYVSGYENAITDIREEMLAALSYDTEETNHG